MALKGEKQKITPAEFWDWFSENEKRLANLNQIKEAAEKDKVQADFIGKLHEYRDGLFFEVGGRAGGEGKDFIVTAEGNKDLFAAVEELVQAAPVYPDWNIMALKPPMGVDFQLDYEGIKLDPNRLWFLPLKNEENPELVGLRVGIPEFDPEQGKKYIAGLYIILDALLGEKSNAQDIGYIEVDPLPEGYTGRGYIEMALLPEFIRIRMS